MLIVEISNDESVPVEEALGITRAGNYDYVVRVGRKEVARGRIENHDRRTHFSLLLTKIANDARYQELLRIGPPTTPAPAPVVEPLPKLRTLYYVLDAILTVVPPEVECRSVLIDMQGSAAFAPPELQGFWWNEVAAELERAIPNPPETEWQRQAVEIFMGKIQVDESGDPPKPQSVRVCGKCGHNSVGSNGLCRAPAWGRWVDNPDRDKPPCLCCCTFPELVGEGLK